MKALIYKGKNQITVEERPKPEIIDPNDAIVKLKKTTICGTDLHILHGDVDTCLPGRVLGHEGIGVIEAIGSNVTEFSVGDLVVIACISACCKCDYCRQGMYSHCKKAGWLLGNTMDGTQAEYVRIPYADTSLYKIPQRINEDAAVLLSDVLPSGYECGVLNGKIQPGATVAIIGAGPVGLSTLLSAQFFSPHELIVVDINDHRLQMAKKLGATHVINSKREDYCKTIMEITHQQGVNTVIEAVGTPETFAMCESILAPGGTIANIGIHGVPVTLNLERLWRESVSIHTRIVDTSSIRLLLDCVCAEKIDPSALITHHFAFKDILKAYEIFMNAEANKALKIILTF